MPSGYDIQMESWPDITDRRNIDMDSTSSCILVYQSLFVHTWCSNAQDFFDLVETSERATELSFGLNASNGMSDTSNSLPHPPEREAKPKMVVMLRPKSQAKPFAMHGKFKCKQKEPDCPPPEHILKHTEPKPQPKARPKARKKVSEPIIENIMERRRRFLARLMEFNALPSQQKWSWCFIVWMRQCLSF